jgi:hypothetical protein
MCVCVCVCVCFKKSSHFSFQELEVYSDIDLFTGSVIQEWSVAAPLFQLRNSSGQIIYRMKGPPSSSSCCGSNYQARFDVSIITS